MPIGGTSSKSPFGKTSKTSTSGGGYFPKSKTTTTGAPTGAAGESMLSKAKQVADMEQDQESSAGMFDKTKNKEAETFNKMKTFGKTKDTFNKAKPIGAPEELDESESTFETADGVAQATAGTAKEDAGYTATTQEVDPVTLASQRLADITAQDSPLMQRARQEGILMAGRRGLQNSSIAAGAAMGAMVDKVAPLAMQESEIFQRQALTNQEDINEAARVTEELQQQASIVNAQLETAVSQGNAAAINDAQTQLRNISTQLQLQEMAGTQAKELANIQGQYNQLIASNESASSLYNAYFQSISGFMGNKEMSPRRVADLITMETKILSSGLTLIDEMNTLDLGATQRPLPYQNLAEETRAAEEAAKTTEPAV